MAQNESANDARGSIVRRRGLFRSAGIISAAVLLSRVTGMVREVIMARLFGAGSTYDAFLLGMRIPNLTRNLFAEGAAKTVAKAIAR